MINLFIDDKIFILLINDLIYLILTAFNLIC